MVGYWRGFQISGFRRVYHAGCSVINYYLDREHDREGGLMKRDVDLT